MFVQAEYENFQNRLKLTNKETAVRVLRMWCQGRSEITQKMRMKTALRNWYLPLDSLYLPLDSLKK